MAVVGAARFALTQAISFPRHALRLAQRNLRGLTVVVIVYLASFVVGSAYAAASADNFSNVSRAIQACNIESFSGQAACRISDYSQSVGLPLRLKTIST